MIGVVADDLTGAAEIGGVALRLGFRADIIMDSSGLADSNADLLCWDTDSRSRPAEEAARRAAQAARHLTDAGCKWLYKKVDSVLRGNVIQELEAILIELDLRRAMLGPANPSLGRVIRDGHYFVRGEPIHQTEFVRDPHHPRLSSRAIDLVASPGRFTLHLCPCRAKLPPSGISLLEVSSSPDVHAWADCWRPDILAAGGAEFFAAWLTRCARQRFIDPHSEAVRVPSEPLPPEIQELFICGTTSESCREFIRLQQQSGTPVFGLPKEIAQGASFTPDMMTELATRATDALRKHPRIILWVGLPLIREPVLARQLTPLLLRVATEVLARANPNRIYVEGGATAVELVRRMGWSRLPVVLELSQGVTMLGVPGNKSLRIIIKPGTYLWPATIRQA